MGANGEGKTTILEGIALLLSLRSFRTVRIRDAVREGETEAHIWGKLGHDETELKVELRPKGRGLFRDGEKQRGARNYLKDFRAISLAPEHYRIVEGSPEERRRFLDQLLFNLEPEYEERARRYHRALRHKQALLRGEQPFDQYRKEVEPFEITMSENAEGIRGRRGRAANLLTEKASFAYREISAKNERLSIRYPGAEKSLPEELARLTEAEHAAKRALCGPHLDSVEMGLGQRDARATASHGEKGSLLLALKLSELEMVKENTEEKPVLLLDDLGATLDKDRRERLLANISSLATQAVATSADPHMADAVRNRGGAVLRRTERLDSNGFSIAMWGTA